MSEEEIKKEEEVEEQAQESEPEEPEEGPIDEKELVKRIQVILFAAGRPISLEELISMTREQEPRAIKKAIAELEKQMEERDSPLMVVEYADAWKLAIKDQYLTFITDLIPSMDLDKATLETLAIIAWRHPVLQADVVKIRTSNAYEHIAKLVDLGFISKERHGRSFVIKPTNKFFEYFDLPSKEAIKEMFKGVADGLRIIDESKEKQKEVGEFEDDKLGDLNVYEAKPEEKKEEVELEPGDHVGKLKVYDEPGAESETEEGSEEEGSGMDFDFDKKETETEAEETTEIPEEKDDGEKAMEVINHIAETEEESEPTEESEETEEQEPEVPEHDLDPALEEFAGIKKPEEKETEEESEPAEEESAETPETDTEAESDKGIDKLADE